MKKLIIGRKDRADFPKLNLNGIAVKIDTGAYTSSIHCTKIIEKNNLLKCSFIDREHQRYDGKMFTFTEYKLVRVKSSNGVIQERYAIKSNIKLFDKVYQITLTLSDRKDMRHPVLIGRKFLSGKFIVDPQLENLSYEY